MLIVFSKSLKLDRWIKKNKRSPGEKRPRVSPLSFIETNVDETVNKSEERNVWTVSRHIFVTEEKLQLLYCKLQLQPESINMLGKAVLKLGCGTTFIGGGSSYRIIVIKTHNLSVPMIRVGSVAIGSGNLVFVSIIEVKKHMMSCTAYL